MKLSVILLLIGVAIIGYAHSLPPYKDEALFTERYMALSNGQSTEYWKFRDEMLTPKFQLQDYGGTLVARAVVVFVVPFFTVAAYVFDLFQGFDRGEFPHWADSMSIPLMGAPVMLIVLLVWSGAHLAFLRSPYQPSPLVRAMSRKSSWWLLSVSAITVVLVVFCALVGQYWYAIPGVVWFYFYISLAAARRATYAAEPVAPEGRYVGEPTSRP